MLKRPRRRSKPAATETRAVELLTHAWMLSVVTALACEMVAALAALYLKAVDSTAVTLGVFAGFMLFAALVIGIVSLVMLPLVLWKRSVPPPRGVTALAIVAGAAPLVVVLLRTF